MFTIDGKICYFSTIDGRYVCLVIMVGWWVYELDFAHSLQWRHNERDGVSNHQPHDCLLNRLFRFRSKKTSKLCGNGFCEGISTVTGEFLSQRASNAENASIWWRHHVLAQSVGHSALTRAYLYNYRAPFHLRRSNICLTGVWQIIIILFLRKACLGSIGQLPLKLFLTFSFYLLQTSFVVSQ